MLVSSLLPATSNSLLCLCYIYRHFLKQWSAQGLFTMVHWASMPSNSFVDPASEVDYWCACSINFFPLQYVVVGVATATFSIISWLMVACHMCNACTGYLKSVDVVLPTISLDNAIEGHNSFFFFLFFWKFFLGIPQKPTDSSSPLSSSSKRQCDKLFSIFLVI